MKGDMIECVNCVQVPAHKSRLTAAGCTEAEVTAFCSQ